MSFQESKVNSLDETDPEFCITIDVEWSPDELIDIVIDKLNSYKIKATFFATHPVRIKGHEIALHPNYLSFETYEETIAKLLGYFQNAKGVRGHRLMTDELLLSIYQKLGILYQSGYLMLGMKNIRPFFLEFNVMEIPLFYMDRIHFDEPWFSKKGFSINSIDLKSPGLKVFDFHPIHVFLNTEKSSRYETAKKYYHEPKLLESYRNKAKEGIGTYFDSLLESLSKNGHRTYTLTEIYKKYKKPSD